MKKDKEDGPDVKGGYVDALIVHASRVQKVTENGKCFMQSRNIFLHFISIILSLYLKKNVILIR